ncbi:hypothetical protein cypCar_00017960 [Cyprinus carpio]|nr:hypothetical protein cypCar_00017960 [Cyprinus carpio]
MTISELFFVQALSIDTKKKTVTFDDGLIQCYDQILIATGCSAEFRHYLIFVLQSKKPRLPWCGPGKCANAGNPRGCPVHPLCLHGLQDSRCGHFLRWYTQAHSPPSVSLQLFSHLQS